MKIRNGFVSNSSSSSFLLVFNKKPKSALDVLAHIWPKLGMIGNPYDTFECFPVSQAAEAVWEQIKDTGSLTFPELTREFRADDNVTAGLRGEHESWDEVSKHMDEQAAILAKSYKDKNKGKLIYRVSFSDNDGPFGATMEHGDVFRKIDHKSFSHH